MITKKTKKIVLIGDIVASRKIKKRKEIQQKMILLFKTINKRNRDLASSLTITLGDEFQAVYNRADSIFSNIWQMLLSVYPEKIRFSLGIGEITTSINPKQAIGMDGPAFYKARSGLNELKQTSFLFNVTCEEISKLELIKQSLFLISHLSLNWKETRLQILTLLYEKMPANDISKKIKITDKAVYKNVDAGSLQVIISLTNEISKELNKLVDLPASRGVK